MYRGLVILIGVAAAVVYLTFYKPIPGVLSAKEIAALEEQKRLEAEAKEKLRAEILNELALERQAEEKEAAARLKQDEPAAEPTSEENPTADLPEESFGWTASEDVAGEAEAQPVEEGPKKEDVLVLEVNTDVEGLKATGGMLVLKLKESGALDLETETESLFGVTSEEGLRKVMEASLELTDGDAQQAAKLLSFYRDVPLWAEGRSLQSEMDLARDARNAAIEAELKDYEVVGVTLLFDSKYSLGRHWYQVASGKRDVKPHPLNGTIVAHTVSSEEELIKLAERMPVKDGLEAALGAIKEVRPEVEWASRSVEMRNIKVEELPEWVGEDKGSPRATLEAFFRANYPKERELALQAEREARGAHLRIYRGGRKEIENPVWDLVAQFMNGKRYGKGVWSIEHNPGFWFKSEQDYREFVTAFTGSEIGRGITPDKFVEAFYFPSKHMSLNPTWAPNGVAAYTRKELKGAFAKAEAAEVASPERNLARLVCKKRKGNFAWRRALKLAESSGLGALEKASDGGTEHLDFQSQEEFDAFVRGVLDTERSRQSSSLTIGELEKLVRFEGLADDGALPVWAKRGLGSHLRKNFAEYYEYEAELQAEKEKERLARAEKRAEEKKRSDVSSKFRLIGNGKGSKALYSDIGWACHKISQAKVIQRSNQGVLILEFESKKYFDGFINQYKGFALVAGKHTPAEMGAAFTIQTVEGKKVPGWVGSSLSTYLEKKYGKTFR